MKSRRRGERIDRSCIQRGRKEGGTQVGGPAMAGVRGYSQALGVAGDAPRDRAEAQAVAVHAGGRAGTLGGAGGGGGSAQDARQRTGQQCQAGAHRGAGPCAPGDHGVHAGPAPGAGCQPACLPACTGPEPAELLEARGPGGWVGRWVGVRVGAEEERAGRSCTRGAGRAGLRRWRRRQLHLHPALPRGALPHRCAQVPSAPWRASWRAGLLARAKAGLRAPGGSGSGLALGSWRGARSLHALSRADTGDAGPTPPFSLHPPKKQPQAPAPPPIG